MTFLKQRRIVKQQLHQNASHHSIPFTVSNINVLFFFFFFKKKRSFFLFSKGRKTKAQKYVAACSGLF